jgi:hypothetical protein
MGAISCVQGVVETIVLFFEQIPFNCFLNLNKYILSIIN